MMDEGPGPPAGMNVPDALRNLFPDAGIFGPGRLADMPAGKGAYALFLDLRAPAAFRLRGAPIALPPGIYVYAGSAHGPGGLGARLGRHFRAGKKPHWHVDHLTRAAHAMAALSPAGLSECGIVARLCGAGGFSHPLPGFGSSDCPVCRSHLLAFHGREASGTPFLSAPRTVRRPRR